MLSPYLSHLSFLPSFLHFKSYFDFTVEEGETPETYPYGITSLADKRDFLQKGDIVNFQVSKVKGSSVLRATALAAQRTYIRAKVDSVKGQVSTL
jgi:hypothetical protein